MAVSCLRRQDARVFLDLFLHHREQAEGPWPLQLKHSQLSDSSDFPEEMVSSLPFLEAFLTKLVKHEAALEFLDPS